MGPVIEFDNFLESKNGKLISQTSTSGDVLQLSGVEFESASGLENGSVDGRPARRPFALCIKIVFAAVFSICLGSHVVNISNNPVARSPNSWSINSSSPVSFRRINATIYIDDDHTVPPQNKNPVIRVGTIDEERGAAYMVYEDSYNVTGWDSVWVYTTPNVSPRDAMYAAGYLEGYMTAQNIWYMYKSNLDDWWGSTGGNIPPRLVTFLNENLNWMRAKLEQARSSSIHIDKEEGEYWWAVELFLNQLDGMTAGYNSNCPQGRNLSAVEFAFLMADGDTEDLGPLFGSNDAAPTRSRCTGFVKILPNRSDILFGHTTWDHYAYMLRTLKVYNFTLACSPGQYPEYHSCQPFYHSESISSYPGFIASVDDFIMTSNGLVFMDTSNEVHNKSVLQKIHPQANLAWMRMLVTGILASTTPDWARIFSKYNSGTYNDQWLVLDMKKFIPGQNLSSDGFMVLEQIPNLVLHLDKTDHINSVGYWASFNIPYFPEIYNITGWPATVKEEGTEASWENNSRAKLFKRLHTSVNGLNDMKVLMRYNKWETDLESERDPSYSISSRYDLYTGANSSYMELMGGIDAKVSSVNLAWNPLCPDPSCRPMRFHAINGPTNDNQPTFVWLPEFNMTHLGQPNVFNFTWIEFGPCFSD